MEEWKRKAVCVCVFATIHDKHKSSIININSINEHHILLTIPILIGMPFIIRVFGNKQKNNRLNYLYFRLNEYSIAYLLLIHLLSSTKVKNIKINSSVSYFFALT